VVYHTPDIHVENTGKFSISPTKLPHGYLDAGILLLYISNNNILPLKSFKIIFTHVEYQCFYNLVILLFLSTPEQLFLKTVQLLM